MNTGNQEHIEAYLRRELSSEETVAFEKRMEEDAAFKQEVELYQKLVAGIQVQGRNDLKKELQSLENEIAQNERYTITLQPRHLLRIAVVVILLIIPLYIFYSREDNLFDQYFLPYDNYVASVERGASDLDAYQEAFQAYEVANYSQATQLFASLNAEQQAQEGVIFYWGLSHLALKESKSAINKLKQVLELSGDFQVQAKWYLALAYIQENKKEEARLLLEELVKSGRFQNQKARELLQKLS